LFVRIIDPQSFLALCFLPTIGFTLVLLPMALLRDVFATDSAAGFKDAALFSGSGIRPSML
jgi:hypothetical protein